MDAQRDSPIRRRILTVAAATAAAVVLAFTAMQVVPPVVANLTSVVADGDAATLRAPGASATVTPPAGWVVSRSPWRDGAISVRSPDGALDVAISVTDAPPDAALRTLIDAQEQPVGAVRVEALASGMTTSHADLDGGGLVAVVAVPGGSVALVSDVRGGAVAADYRPSIAELLEGVRGAS